MKQATHRIYFSKYACKSLFKCINIKRNSKSKKYEAFKNKLLSEFKKNNNMK